VQTYVRDQLRRIYEVIEDIPVRARGKARRGFLTDSLNKITGLATKDELLTITSCSRIHVYFGSHQNLFWPLLTIVPLLGRWKY